MHQTFMVGFESAVGLIRLVSLSGRTLELLSVLIRQEIESTDSADMLLRKNNGVSRMLVAYAHLTSNSYIADLIGGSHNIPN